MGVYRIEVDIKATAYVRADSPAEAQAMLLAHDGHGIEFASRDQPISEEMWISGRQYDDPDLPALSLSPAMTLRVPVGIEAEDAEA